jgi:O-antigen ligase
MISVKERQIMQWVLLVGTVFASLIISPTYSLDPINLPKLLVLVPTSFFLFGFILHYRSYFVEKRMRIILASIILFVAQMVLVLSFSGAPFNQQFFGVLGRNTGFVAYLALIAIFLAATIAADSRIIKRIALALLGSGALSILYGLIQMSGNDPIKWNNRYNSIIGFLGNPNFTSSFIGFSSVVSTALFFKSKQKLVYRLLAISFLLLALFVVAKSASIQGILVIGITSSIVTLIALSKFSQTKGIPTKVFAGLIGFSGLIALLGTLKIGPLADYLYKTSVRQRGFYWDAAIEMVKSHPFLGIGFDSYGDWYLQERSANAALLTPTVQSNAAHNVYLDIAAIGGIPLFTLYIFINLYIFWLGFRTIKESPSFDPYYTAIFAAWVGYQTQSIISINQLGVAVWGWVLGGLIIGVSKSFKAPESEKSEGRVAKKSDNSKAKLLFPISGLAIGLAIAVPPYQSDHNFRVKSSSGDGVAVMAAIDKYPVSTGHMLSAARAFVNSGLLDQGIEIAKKVVAINPRDYNAWSLIADRAPVGSEDKIKANAMIRKLDPKVTPLK